MELSEILKGLENGTMTAQDAESKITSMYVNKIAKMSKTPHKEIRNETFLQSLSNLKYIVEKLVELNSLILPESEVAYFEGVLDNVTLIKCLGAVKTSLPSTKNTKGSYDALLTELTGSEVRTPIEIDVEDEDEEEPIF